MKKFVVMLCLLLIIALILSACAPGVSGHHETKRAGFLWGIWHGWIAPVSLIWHIFNPSVRIYETNNVGWWYDFGFYIAILGGFGGFALTRRKRR
ncbi:MAG: hypothetical protein K0B81_00610 [Candidatus Cloacimonetes bacterium]|nr:hypothetical protein [Candidatus Cloacimonadota bacterium]